VIDQSIPILGVCVGMQIMADTSPAGKHRGLSWIPGHVGSLSSLSPSPPEFLPHMGWNSLISTPAHPLFRDIHTCSFYFLHSFYYSPLDSEHILASSTYGSPFASAVFRDNIFGVQFHPEKSHSAGIQLLKNFALL